MPDQEKLQVESKVQPQGIPSLMAVSRQRCVSRLSTSARRPSTVSCRRMCWQHTHSPPNPTSYYLVRALIPTEEIARLGDEAGDLQ